MEICDSFIHGFWGAAMGQPKKQEECNLAIQGTRMKKVEMKGFVIIAEMMEKVASKTNNC